MKPIQIIGRLGPSDRTRVASPREVESVNCLVTDEAHRFTGGLHQAFDELQRLGMSPTEIGVDLLVLAAVVHAADTRIQRDTHGLDGWTRQFRLNLPVSDPQRWAALTERLGRMLRFLTGDIWDLTFRPRPRRSRRIIEADTGTTRESQVAPRDFTSLCLFSGGLDSLIGAIDLYADNNTTLLISHASDGPASTAQDACFRAMSQHFDGVERSRAWYQPEKQPRLEGAETTTRGRSFLFFSLAAFAGAGMPEGTTIHVPENGLISLNVPLHTLRLGALSTRTTHPFYMRSWNWLLESLGLPCRVENPYQYQTKGEMVAGCREKSLLESVAADTMSCSSPTKGRWSKLPPQHCGHCVPCLIRRAAFGAAGWEDATPYTLADVAGQTLDSERAEGEQVRSFQLACRRLAANPELARLLIYKSGPLPGDTAEINRLADVYRRGMAEVDRLLARTRTVRQ